ncbi:hypothetical protein HN587_04770 [Candidatus Woesearchaeota archaeon]|nr:hypothetical protein [Candidatus Woesearchaeota archaeon]
MVVISKYDSSSELKKLLKSCRSGANCSSSYSSKSDDYGKIQKRTGCSDFFDLASNAGHYSVLSLPEQEVCKDKSLVPFARVNLDSEFIYEPGCTFRSGGNTFFLNQAGAESSLEGILNYVAYSPFPTEPYFSFRDIGVATEEVTFTQKLVKNKIRRETSSNFKKSTWYKFIDFLDSVAKVDSFNLHLLFQKQVNNFVALNFILANILFQFNAEFNNLERYRKVLNSDISSFSSCKDENKSDLMKKLFVYSGLSKKLKQHSSVNSGSSDVLCIEDALIESQDELRRDFLNFSSSNNSFDGKIIEKDFILKYKSLMWKTISVVQELLYLGVDLENSVRRSKSMYSLIVVSPDYLGGFQALSENVFATETAINNLTQSFTQKLKNLKLFGLDRKVTNFFLNNGDSNTAHVLHTLSSRDQFDDVRANRVVSKFDFDSELAEFESKLSG